MRIACVVLLLASLAPAEFLLKDGDRVVFLGDSITEAKHYARYIQQYVYGRYPDLDIRFFNAGWGGDTARRAVGRLERDVFSLNPTVVTVCFGMNDGATRPPDRNNTKVYRESLGALVKALRARKVRVVVFSPTCVDPDPAPKKNWLTKYNETLREFTKIAGDIARKHSCPFVNIFKPMLSYQQSRKEEDPKWTMIPDGVHPNEHGHLVMARWMLVALKADPMPPLGTMNVGKGSGKGLRLVAKDEGRVVLQTEAPVPVPFWYPRHLRDTVDRCGMADFYVGHKLEVRGLTRADYYVTVQGIDCGQFKSTAFIRGVPVSGFDTRSGKRVSDLISIKDKQYADAWRNVRLPLAHLEGVEAAVDGLMRAVDGYHRMIRAQARKPAPVQIVLTRVPTGRNYALNAKYQASDPHRDKRWAAGLTDGSWAADRDHCFSTFNGGFPKHVLIDLGARRSIACIRLGVPPYGSTKSIRIEVSRSAVRYRKVVEHSFRQRCTQRVAFWFKPSDVRFIRLTYLDAHAEFVGIDPRQMLTTEIEAYEK